MTEAGHEDCADPADCIEAGDPQYDGFRLNDLWVVTSVDPGDDQEGLVGDLVVGGPLMASDRRRLEQYLEPYVAKLRAAHPETTVSIKHFTLKEVT